MDVDLDIQCCSIPEGSTTTMAVTANATATSIDTTGTSSGIMTSISTPRTTGSGSSSSSNPSSTTGSSSTSTKQTNPSTVSAKSTTTTTSEGMQNRPTAGIRILAGLISFLAALLIK